MQRYAALVCSVIASGLLLALALPPHGWSFLGWIAFVPVLVAVADFGFAFGLVFGILTCLIAAWFDAHGFLLKGDVVDGSPEWIYAGFLLFGLITGFAMRMWVASPRLKGKTWALAAWAVLFEAVLLLYLPAHMALTQSRSTALLYLTSWTGIWGVSYLVWFANFGIAQLLLQRKRRKATGWFLACCLVSLSWLPAERGNLKIAMIQTRSSDADDLTTMNRRAGLEGAVLAVWPELSGMVMATGGKTDDLEKLAVTKGQPAFVTTYEDPADPLPFNVAQVFSSEGASAKYRKRKPFAGEAQQHAAGKSPAAVTVGGETYGLNICFDSCFPSVMRDTARQPKVGVILLPTLDPVTSYGAMQSIHAAYTPFRSAEIGLPIIRSDVSAHSMAVDAFGRALAEMGTEQDEISTVGVKPGKRWTFVTFAGDWFLVLCVLLSAIGFLKPASAKELRATESAQTD
jgi:apolipoprotein N-acyltransferase